MGFTDMVVRSMARGADSMALIEADRDELKQQVQELEAERDGLQARVKDLEAAIHAECARCAAIRGRVERPEDCNWDTCPLWPHRPKQDEGEEG